jgi:hypothetical protein
VAPVPVLAQHGLELEYGAKPCLRSAQYSRLRSGPLEALKQRLLALLTAQLLAPGGLAQELSDGPVVTQLLKDPSIGARQAGLFELIETPEVMKTYRLLARSQANARWRVQRIVHGVQEAGRTAGLADAQLRRRSQASPSPSPSR